MNREEIFKKMAALITPYVGDKTALAGMSEDSDFVVDLKINSAHIVDIVLDLESEFDIMIDDESIGQMSTVRASIDLVQAKQEIGSN